jgi:hypothetical protein
MALALIAGSQQLFAEPSLASSLVAAKKKPAKKPPKSVKPSTATKSSGTGRSGMQKSPNYGPSISNFGMSANVGMVHYETGMGAEAWIGNTLDFQIGAEMLIAKGSTVATDSSTGTVRKEKLVLNLTQFNFFYRQFYVNSFYATYDIGINIVKGQYGFDVTGAEAGASYINYTYTIVAPSVAVGNQWTLDSGAYIGVDWVGYSYPFSNKLKIDSSRSSEKYKEVERRLSLLSDDTIDKIITSNLDRDYGLYYLLIRGGYRF